MLLLVVLCALMATAVAAPDEYNYARFKKAAADLERTLDDDSIAHLDKALSNVNSQLEEGSEASITTLVDKLDSLRSRGLMRRMVSGSDEFDLECKIVVSVLRGTASKLDPDSLPNRIEGAAAKDNWLKKYVICLKFVSAIDKSWGR